MSLPVSWHFVWQDQGTVFALSPVCSLCDLWEVWTWGWWKKKQCAVFEVGLFLLWLGTSCWQEQPSKFTVAVTLLLPLFTMLQLHRALRKPSAGTHGRLAAHRGENEPCLSWQTLPSQGTFAASAERPVVVALVGRRWFQGQDGLFFHLSSLSGNTFCRFFPLCLKMEGRS